MDLAAFYAARLDEDEATAKDAGEESGPVWRRGTEDDMGIVVTDDVGEIVVYDEGRPGEDEAEHIARHDPARVLREVEAGRELILLYKEAWAAIGRGPVPIMAAAVVRRDTLHRVLVAAVAVYGDHPDYEPAWAPVTAGT